MRLEGSLQEDLFHCSSTVDLNEKRQSYLLAWGRIVMSEIVPPLSQGRPEVKYPLQGGVSWKESLIG